MRKFIALFLILFLFFSVVGCSKKDGIKNTIEGNLKTYYEMSDGTWKCDDVSYTYRLEIIGRLNNALCDSKYVFLSNLENITFEQAWKASGLSSNLNDYFSVEEAVLVDVGTEK